MPNIIQSIRKYNAGRDPERLQMKYRNMRADPFVFLRGTCHLFYDRLPQTGIIKTAPPGWICGDLHLENFGSFQAENGLTYFDISDFDEALLAPVSWDLVRFLCSVLVAADSLSISPAETKALCKKFMTAYTTAISSGKSRWLERDIAQGLVGRLLTDLRERKPVDFLNQRTERKGKTRVLKVNGKKALPASKSERASVTEFMKAFAATQPDPDFYKVLDVARRIAGTGSLGLHRYVILVRGKGRSKGNVLLDLRPAIPSSLGALVRLPQPEWQSEAARVVELQLRMQAVSMAFLHPVKLGKLAYVLRGLQPSEDKVSLDRTRQSSKQLQDVIGTMGNLVAWAHLRSAGRQGSAIADELINFAQQKKWQKPLLETSLKCAAQVRKDWKTFAEAFDAGDFDT